MAFTWTDEYPTRLVLAVFDQVIRLGASYDGTFKKPMWTKIEREFNRSQPNGATVSRKQLQSKVAELKKKYKTYAAMKNNSGFGWDPQTNLPTAPESVCDDIIAEHPQAREFKTRPLIMYDELDQMFSGRRPPASNEDEVDSDEDEDECTNVEPSPRTSRRRSRGTRSSLTATQGANDNDGSAKRYKSTGEKMTEAILVLADANKTLAVTSAARQAGDCMCKLSRSDVAIKEFKEQVASTVEVSERFRFIQRLATNQNAATMYCGMDDEYRCYFVQEYLQGNRDFQ